MTLRLRLGAFLLWKRSENDDIMFILNLRQGCILMKQEYTDKMKYYQGKEYENFLREKCVLDARQFLYSSQLYLNYAIITAKLYEDIGEKEY